METIFIGTIDRTSYNDMMQDPDIFIVYGNVFNEREEAINVLTDKINELIGNDLSNWGYGESETCFGNIYPSENKDGEIDQLFVETDGHIDPEDRVCYIGHIIKAGQAIFAKPYVPGEVRWDALG